MLYSIFSQIIYSIITSSLSPYINNVIRDYKTPIINKGSKIGAQYIVTVYTLYYWVTSILDIFLWITMQIQYIIPCIIIDIIIKAYFTDIYMTNNNQSLF